MNTATILLIILAAIGGILIAYFQYYYRTKKKDSINFYLFIIRSLVFFLLFLLLINPSIERISYVNQKPSLSVLIDNSKSIRFFNQDSTVESIVGKLKTDRQLSNKFDVNFYSFGNNFQLLDTLDFSENQSNLYLPIQSINKIEKRGNSTSILISDGNQTLGRDYEFVNPKMKIYPLIVGDTTKYEDISIAQLNVNRYSFLNNQFPLEALILYKGDNRTRARFTIENQGKTIFSKIVQLDVNKTTQTIRTNFTSKKEGINFYKAKIDFLKNEKNINNNSKDFSIEVIDKQSQILILSPFYHPDLGALKKSIESDKQRKVVIRLVDEEQVKFDDYQLVILYQPNFQFKEILTTINNKKVNYLLITGTKTDWNFINNEGLGILKNSINQSQDYLARFNPGFLTFSQKDIRFSSFPPLADKFGQVSINIPHQTLLFQDINGFTSETPLLYSVDENNHKKIYLLGEGIWKWRSASYLNSNSFEEFDDFIANIVQYASSKKIRDRLDIEVEQIYNANSIIQLNAFYVDANYEFDDRATLIFNIKNNLTNERFSYPFSLAKNSYQLSIESLEPGEYTYTVIVEGQNISKGGVFKVNEYSAEEQFTNANQVKLAKIAEKTEAKHYYTSETQQLISDLLNNTDFKTTQKSIEKKESLIDWKWILFILVGLLAIEWFTRKYHGKI